MFHDVLLEILGGFAGAKRLAQSVQGAHMNSKALIREHPMRLSGILKSSTIALQEST